VFAMKTRWNLRSHVLGSVWRMVAEWMLARLAACYGFGLARNHPFRDGNKRVAFW